MFGSCHAIIRISFVILIVTHCTSRICQADNPHNITQSPEEVAAATIEIYGDPSCPCLPQSDDDDRLEIDLTESLSFYNLVGSHMNISTYGFGCFPHDTNTRQCSDFDDCTKIVPLPEDCDQSWCARSWCYIDPSNCTLKKEASIIFKNRFYSYASCGYLDSFTYTERIQSIQGKTYKVGYNSNSGGWKGAYNSEGGSFALNTAWEGPIVEFIRDAALQGGFTIRQTVPPDWLYAKSQEFFGDSKFDYCTYATALGYLDFCVGAYTITEKRASVTTFYETANDPIYLIVFDDNNQGGWSAFVQTATTIFAPFTLGSWCMIFLVCLPVLGILMLYHEYNSPGSAYPKTEPILVVSSRNDETSDSSCTSNNNNNNKHMSVQLKEISLWNHATTSLYMAWLSFFQGSYDHSVITMGGKITLLAISSFVMLVVAVYTANLAAILTQTMSAPKVDSLQAALQQGYNFCASRQITNIIMDVYKVDGDRIVPDPIEFGGDGLPGFNCPDCSVRERVLEMMQASVTNRTMHCQAAIASVEDLEVFHGIGEHCDKMKIGETLAYRSIGIPINEAVSEELVSFFHQLKTASVMDRALNAAKPESQCSAENGEDGEGSALSIKQMTGVWVITFGFAVMGVLVKYCYYCSNNSGGGIKNRNMTQDQERSEERRTLRRFDQWANPPGYDVIIHGHRYDAENHSLTRIAAFAAELDDNDDNTSSKNNTAEVEELAPLQTSS